MTNIATITRLTLDCYYRALKVCLTFLMLLMIVPVLLQILSRYSGIFPRYIWTEEAARFCFVWIIMIGSMIAVRDETHFKVDLLPQPETLRQEGSDSLVVHIAMLLMSLVFVLYGCFYGQFGFMQKSEMSGINMLSIYISFPLAGLTWAVFLIERMVNDVKLILGKDRETKSESTI